MSDTETPAAPVPPKRVTPVEDQPFGTPSTPATSYWLDARAAHTMLARRRVCGVGRRQVR